MPGQQELIELFDLPKSQKDKETMIGYIQEIDQKIKSFSGLSLAGKNVNGLADFKRQSAEMATAMEQIASMQKKLIEMENQLAAARTKGSSAGKAKTKEELEAQVAIQLERQKTIAGIKDEIKLNQAAEESLTKKRIQLKQLQQQYDDLSGAQKRSAEGAALLNRVNAQSRDVKAEESATGRDQRNVGNYPGKDNFSGALQTLESSLTQAKQKYDSLTESEQQNSEVGQKLQSEIQLLNELVGQQTKGFTSLAREVMSTGRALETMAGMGMRDTEAFKSLETQFANAKRELTEFREQQKLIANTAPQLAAMTLAAKGLMGVYATGAGAVTLFADGNEKVEKELNKLVAVMTILQGLEEIHRLAMEKGAIATVFQSTASKVATFAQKIWTATMLESTVATAAFRATLITLTGGLLLLAPLIAFAFGEMSTQIKRQREEQELLNEINKAAIDSYSKEKTELDLLVAEVKDENLAKKDRLAILKELQEKFPGYFDNIKTEADLTDKLTIAYHKAAEGILAKARANAAQGLIEKNQKEILETELEYQKKINDANDTTAGLLGYKNKKALQEELRRQQEVDIKKLLDDDDFYTKQVLANQEKVAKEGGKIGKEEKSPADTVNKEIEARIKLLELLKQEQIERLRVISDNENAPEKARIKALQEAFVIENDIIETRRRLELSKEKLTASEKALIIEKANDDLYKAQTTFDLGRLQIHAQALQKELDLEKEFGDEILEKQKNLEKAKVDLMKNQVEKRVGYIEEARDILISALDKEYAAGAINEEQYQERRKKAETEADIFILQARLALVKIGTPEYANIERQINDKKNEDKLNSDKKYLTEKKKLKEQEISLEKKGAEEVESAIEAFVIGAYTKQLNSIQDQIDASNKLRDTRISDINSSSLSEQDKAAKLIQINQQAVADQDKLQKQQRDIKLKEAKFERDKAVIDVLVSTYKAVAQTELQAAVLASNPLTAALAATALAQVPLEIGIGAVQVAAILARGLPKFASGVESSPEGWALTDEKGPEGYQTPSGKMFMGNDRPTLRYLERGTKIIPNDRVNEMMYMNAFRGIIMPQPNNDEVIREMKGMRMAMQDQTSRLEKAYSQIRVRNTVVIKQDYRNDYIP